MGFTMDKETAIHANTGRCLPNMTRKTILWTTACFVLEDIPREGGTLGREHPGNFAADP